MKTERCENYFGFWNRMRAAVKAIGLPTVRQDQKTAVFSILVISCSHWFKYNSFVKCFISTFISKAIFIPKLETQMFNT